MDRKFGTDLGDENLGVTFLNEYTSLFAQPELK